MLQLPRFERFQRQGQSGRLAEDVLIVAKQPRPSQHVDQLLVLIVVYGRSVGHGSEPDSFLRLRKCVNVNPGIRDQQNSCSFSRTTSTGQGAARTTRSAVLPMQKCLKPV